MNLKLSNCNQDWNQKTNKI